ncbi:WcbI family polysaccharide biosynthesis putative acetyltransferase [Kytococcus sp. Marseille-QA3725]
MSSTEDAGRRRHYGQFYGLTPVPDGPVGMVHGNCQAESLRVLLEAADPERTWVRLPPVHELTAEDLPHLERLLARTTTIVTQPVRDDYRDLPLGTRQVVDRAVRDAVHVMVPIIRYRGLHPQQRLVRGPGIPDPPVVPYHHTGAVARAAGLPDPRPSARVIREIAVESLAEQRRREELAGALPVHDLQQAAGARATNTINHPGNPVLLGLAARVTEAVGATGEVGDPGRELLRSIYAPVTAETLEALGLEGTPREDWRVGDKTLTDEHVVAEQARWLRENPRVLAFALEKVADDLRRTGVVGARRGAGTGTGHGTGPGGSAGEPAAAAPEPLHLVVGPDRHGVVLHALRIAEAAEEEVLRVEDPAAAADLRERLTDRAAVTHFTDRAWGSTPAEAAEQLAHLTERAASLQVVLHDVPQDSDGAGQDARCAAYSRVCAAADRVVVSSEHERGLLAAATGTDADRIGVVPLPLERARPDRAGATDGDTTDEEAAEALEADPTPTALPPGRWVATLGFLYPGKGVEEVVDATAAAARDPRLAGGPGADRRPTGVLNLGRPAPGHEDLVEQLEERARAAGTVFRATGWLDDAELTAACREVTVPVAYHRHVSASGSVNTWLASGRRPLVAASPYTQEQAARLPGAMVLVDHDEELAGLTGALVDALADPTATRPADEVDLWPSWRRAATMLRSLR